MAKALKIAAVVVGVAALAIVTAGAGVAIAAGTSLVGSLSTGAALFGFTTGISLGGALAISAGLSMAGSLLAGKPKSPAVSAANADRLSVSIDLSAPRKIIFGRTAMATDLRDQEYTDSQKYLHRWIVVAAHRVHSIEEIWLDDKLAWTVAGGAQGEFAGYLEVTPVLEGSAANAINVSSRMGSARRYTGCAYVYLRYKLTGNSKKTDSPFAQSITSRVTIIGCGMPTYDVRLDSTAGGSGSHRADDQSTWAWDDDASRNPIVQQCTYLLGWRINGKLSVGKGMPAARIDLGSAMPAANLCDEPVALPGGGTEPRYRSDGIFSEGDPLSTVLDGLKAACNGMVDDADGRLRLSVLHNDLGAPREALTTDDVLGEFTWTQTPDLSQSVNVLTGRYTDASSTSLYQLVPGPDVRGDSPDGIDRPQAVDLPMVQSATQRQRLLKLRLQRLISGAGTFQADFQATAWRYQKNDVVPFTFAPLGWTAKLFRIADLAAQVNGVVPMLLREEHADIYAAESDADAAIVGADPTTYIPALAPIIQAIDDAASDGILSHGSEKSDAIIDSNALTDDFTALDAQYVALGSPSGLSGVRGAAYAALGALDSYLAGLSPAWNDTTLDTPIDAATWRATWGAAYNAISDFRAGIAGYVAPRGAYDVVLTTPTYPFTSDDDSISTAGLQGTLEDGREYDFPAGTITGLSSGTDYVPFWNFAGSYYYAEPYPALTGMADPANVFFDRQVTSASGSYPTPDTPPPGFGGGYCPADDTMFLLANEARDGPGIEIAMRDLVVGRDWAWTRHEHSGEWSAYPLAALRFADDAPVFRAEAEMMPQALAGIPVRPMRATADHPIGGVPWTMLGGIGAPDGTARIAIVEVTDAHTYVANGVLSHNKRATSADG